MLFIFECGQTETQTKKHTPPCIYHPLHLRLPANVCTKNNCLLQLSSYFSLIWMSPKPARSILLWRTALFRPCFSDFPPISLSELRWKVSLSSYLGPCLLCTEEIWSPHSTKWVILSLWNKVSPCTLWLIHVWSGIPSQLRSFHVNGVLITSVHKLRGRLCQRKTTEPSCLNDCVSLFFYRFPS